MATNHKNVAKRTHISIETLVQNAAMVGTSLPYFVLQHSLLFTLAACNDRDAIHMARAPPFSRKSCCDKGRQGHGDWGWMVHPQVRITK